MKNILLAKDILEKTEYRHNENHNSYTNSIFTCKKCGDELAFAYDTLHKYRFSKSSNLNKDDRILMDKLILSLIPKNKIRKYGKIQKLTNRDRFTLLFQRLYLRLIGVKGKFPNIPLANDNTPDSFIDYYCPKCATPIRVYYYSYIRVKERGFIIKYIIN
jgi:hypothetical protein